jgi:hypothetical protein
MVEDEESKKAGDKHRADKPKAKRWPLKKWVVVAVAVIAAAAIFASSYVYTVSPGPIRSPQMDHYHFRMQVVVDGKDVDFSTSTFQTPYAKDQCSVDLATEPIHFHDQKGQFVHIHWTGITGGIVLKNYGWNFIGGQDNLLGYRTDDLPRVTSVPAHGNNLPELPANATIWVYSGDESGHQKRSLAEFTDQDLEKFFNKESNFPASAQSGGVMSWLFPKASAHGSEHAEEAAVLQVSDAEEERLTRLHNLLGNVVIFVQASEPTDEQVTAKFSNLEPLSDSTCGG